LPKSFDAGMKTKDRKRHIITDTLGNLVGLVAPEAAFDRNYWRFITGKSTPLRKLSYLPDLCHWALSKRGVIITGSVEEVVPFSGTEWRLG
jgi:hypothetical protein